MGTYVIRCPSCGEQHAWFSGRADQRCKACRDKEKSDQGGEGREGGGG
jgi:hypothetical protein